MATLFAGIGAGGEFRLTRMRADLAKSALANDLVLQASQDQGVLSNLRRPQMVSGVAQCPSFGGCPGDTVGGGGAGGGTSSGGGAAGGTMGGGGSSFSCAVSDTASNQDFWSIAGLAAAIGLAVASASRRRASR